MWYENTLNTLEYNSCAILWEPKSDNTGFQAYENSPLVRELPEYSGTRDLRQFPGTTKKTLQRQSLEAVFVPRKRRTRPSPVAVGQTPRFRPRLTAPVPNGLGKSPSSCHLKKLTKTGVKRLAYGILELWLHVIYLYLFICLHIICNCFSEIYLLNWTESVGK